MTQPAAITLLEKTIGITFRNKDLLIQALVHRSSVRERASHGNNERLEFFGIVEFGHWNDASSSN